MSRKIYKPYFSHDIHARADEKIKDMLFELRKKDPIKAWAAYGLYWAIVEYMHYEDFKIDKLEMYSDDLRIDIDFLKAILEDFKLFNQKDGNYISDRVIRNIQEQEEKSKKARQSASKRDYKKKSNTPEDAPLQHEVSLDDVFISEVIQLFNQEFKKTQIVSNENKIKIAEITTKNQLKIEDWKIIFSNAKRGWDYPDGKNIKPSLKKVIENWDSFRSDDYNLAEGKEDIKKAQELAKQIEKDIEKQFDSNADIALFIYEDYRFAKNIVKLEAQKAYRKYLPDGEDKAIAAACKYCREQAQ